MALQPVSAFYTIDAVLVPNIDKLIAAGMNATNRTSLATNTSTSKTVIDTSASTTLNTGIIKRTDAAAPAPAPPTSNSNRQTIIVACSVAAAAVFIGTIGAVLLLRHMRKLQGPVYSDKDGLQSITTEPAYATNASGTPTDSVPCSPGSQYTPTASYAAGGYADGSYGSAAQAAQAAPARAQPTASLPVYRLPADPFAAGSLQNGRA